MKQRLRILLTLFCATVGFSQGLRGNITVRGQATLRVTGHSVTLTWIGSEEASGYNVYRGIVRGGPYTQIASGILCPSYSDVQVTSKQTLYYVTTAINNTRNESFYSNEAVAVIP